MFLAVAYFYNERSTSESLSSRGIQGWTSTLRAVRQKQLSISLHRATTQSIHKHKQHTQDAIMDPHSVSKTLAARTHSGTLAQSFFNQLEYQPSPKRCKQGLGARPTELVDGQQLSVSAGLTRTHGFKTLQERSRKSMHAPGDRS